MVNIFSFIVNVEARCYERMRTFGVLYGVCKVYIVGGGVKNGVWSGMCLKVMGDIFVE